MDLSLIKLGGCTGKDGMGFALVVAMAVLVVEGDVAYAGPAVFYDNVWLKMGHGIIHCIYYKVTHQNLIYIHFLYLCH